MEPDDVRVVTAWGRAAVRELPTGEMPLYKDVSQAYFRDGIRLDSRERDALPGFGLDVAVTLVTGVALTACARIWQAVCEKAGEAT